jgi:CubicO group peptidase (beta-lactamase class C family)
VLVPLGLGDTGFQVRSQDAGRLGPIYEWRDDAFVVAEDPSRSPLLSPPIAVSGGGGWGDTGSLGGAVSTAADLLRFLRMLAAGGELDGVRVLAPETVALMTRDQLDGKPSIGPGYGYGLGVGVVTDPTIPRDPMGRGAFYWGGSENTSVWVDPERELIGVFLTQISPFGHRGLVRRYQGLVYEALASDERRLQP